MLKIMGIYKKYCLNFQPNQGRFFSLVCFSIYNMVDSEYSIDTYKSVKINFGAVMRNSEMWKFVPAHLKTKIMCKDEVKKLPLLIRYVPDQCKTQYMCGKAVVEKCGTLESVLDSYKNQEKWNKSVDNYPHTLDLFLNTNKTQENVR